MFAAQDAGKAEAVAEAAGAAAVTTPREAVAGADIVVLAVPYSAVEDVAREIAPVAGGKIVIDPTNPLKADGSGLATAPGTSGAETLAALLPDAKVVKAFNTLFATNTAESGGPRHAARQPVRDGRRGGQGRRVRPERARSASGRCTSARWPRRASSRRWPG